MKNKHFKRLFAVLLSIMFVLSIVLPERALAANTIDRAINLKPKGTYSGNLDEGDMWLKVSPGTMVKTHSHLQFSLEGNAEQYLTVYINRNDAKMDVAYPEYQDQEKVDFPIAWKGPFYIKVSGYGNFKLTSSPIVKAPDIYDGGACMVEESVKGKQSALSLLDSMRTVRDSLLKESEAGKELANLYYDVSKDSVLDVVKDKNYRNTIMTSLGELTPLIKELEKIAERQSSNYQVTTKDYKAMIRLKEAVITKVSPKLAEKVNHYWDTLKLDNIENQKLTEFLTVNQFIGKDFTNKELIVSVKEKSAGAQMLTQSASRLVKNNTAKVQTLTHKGTTIENTYIVRYRGKETPEQMAKKLETLPEIEYVEPNYPVVAFAKDIQYKHHWSLQNTGREEGKKGADIRHNKLQQVLKGKKLTKTLIAVIDTGTNYEIEDLRTVTRTDIDKDFVNNDNDAWDDQDHGTHVASTIAATSNNYYSMTGINSHAKILPVKVLDDSGQGSMSNVALGVRYAVDKGAKVINLSLGASEVSKTLEKELKRANQKGVTVIAASGNNGANKLSYPASSKYTIAVGATNNQDKLADFSNYGKNLDMTAPGVNIPGLFTNGNVTFASGTSMAAPHVSAVAGLLYSANPKIKPDKVKSLLTKNSKDLGKKGYDPKFGWGRLDAAKTLEAQLGYIPTVKKVANNHTKVTGTGKNGFKVIIKKGKTKLGEGKVKNGKFSVNIRKQKAGTTLSITAVDSKGLSGSPVTVKVYDAIPPKKPVVKSATAKKVTGTAEAGSTIKVKKGKKVIGKAITSKKKSFSVKIPKQKKGTKLTVTATDKAGNTSKGTVVKVK